MPPRESLLTSLTLCLAIAGAACAPAVDEAPAGESESAAFATESMLWPRGADGVTRVPVCPVNGCPLGKSFDFNSALVCRCPTELGVPSVAPVAAVSGMYTCPSYSGWTQQGA